MIFLPPQSDKLKERLTKVKELLSNRDSADPEEIKKEVSELQQASLKLFEMAYKKVSQIVKVNLFAWIMSSVLFNYSVNID